MKKFVLVILIFSFLTGCGSVSEGFKLKKGNTGDEFLVEKKNPLVLPPNFDELPEPGKTQSSNDNKEVSFEDKILNSETDKEKQNENSPAKSTEQLIIKNINNNANN